MRKGVLAAFVLLVTALVPAVASASGLLVFSSTELRGVGLEPAGASSHAALVALDSGLPTTTQRAIGGVAAQTSAGRTGAYTVQYDAFSLRNAATAAGALASWTRAHHATRFAIVPGSVVWAKVSRTRATIEILWRHGARLGLIVLTATRDIAAARASAMGYAELAAPLLSAPPPATAWDSVMAQIRPDGTVPESVALQAFALSYGPLPGVTLPLGARTSTESGDLADSWVLPLLPRLPARLRAVIDRDLGFVHPGTSARVADNPVVLTNFGDRYFHPDTTLTEQAEKWATDEGNDLQPPHALGLMIDAGYFDHMDQIKKGADGEALPVNDSGNESPGGPWCRIRMRSGLSVPFTYFVLAHEVFHCFEFELDYGGNDYGGWTHEPPWVEDGLADWAADVVDPGPGNPTFLQYLQTPEVSLLDRAYTAVGFWGHVEDTVGGLWSRVQAILLAHHPQTTIDNAVNPNAAEFYNSWGPSYFENPTAGRDWVTVSPTGQQEPPAAVTTITASSTASLYVAPYATGQYVLDFPESMPLLYVKVTGPGILSEKYGYTHLNGAWFCTSQSCACPADETGTPPPAQPLPPVAELGVSGAAPNGTLVNVQGHSLSDYCHPIKTCVPPGATASDTPRGTAAACNPLLPARSCTTLQFSGIPTMTFLITAGGYPGELEGTQCTATSADHLTDVLLVESTASAAEGIYTNAFVDAGCPAIDGGCTTTPISGVGDAASSYFIPCAAGEGCASGGFTNGGVVQVANDVFDIQSQDDTHDFLGLLKQAVQQLCPGCTFSTPAITGRRFVTAPHRRQASMVPSNAETPPLP